MPLADNSGAPLFADGAPMEMTSNSPKGIRPPLATNVPTMTIRTGDRLPS